MRKQIPTRWLSKTWWTTLAVMAALLIAPLLGVIHDAQAKPPRHAPAYGYRAKQKQNKKYHRRSNRRNYSRRDDSRRRYRTRYRTRYDRNGNPYRQYYRQYY